MVRVANQRSSDEAAVAAVGELHDRLIEHGVGLAVRLWNGDTLGPEDAPWRLVLRHPWSLRALLVPATELNVGETYLDDVVDVEGSMVAALRDLRRLGGLQLGAVEQLSWLRRLPAPPRGAGRLRRSQRPRLRGRVHSQSRDSDAVRSHYDVGNDFYQLFLDPDLVYSCAVFAEQDRDLPATDRSVLARAQQRKLELICRKLHLREGERLLDVGCGWGSLVIHAAREYGVEALGVTLSPAQAELARQRVQNAGLEDRVRIEVLDYRDVGGRFDAIASVGMVEHVGASELARYAGRLTARLNEGGRLLNHGITTGGRDVVRDLSRVRDSFVGRYVFPDGALVPAYRTVTELERAGLELWDVQQLRPHYARTLEHWVSNLESAADTARELVGERTYRVWRAYMAGSAVAFERNELGVVQVLAVRPPHELPFGRAWMEPGSPERPGSQGSDADRGERRR
jgi:cyclopropane-fatty-acyl-phospholipid synthase